jgi:hypothetical protein
MAGSMSIACLLVMAGSAETPMTVVKARAAVTEKRILVVIGSVKVEVFK